MAGQGATSSLRRICTPAGGALLLCLVFAGNAVAVAPSPDPPPLAVAPEEPTSAPASKPAPAVRQEPVAPAPVVTRTVETPVIVTREVPVQVAPTRAPAPKAKPKPKPAAKVKATPKPKRQPVVVEPVLPLHDRSPVPLARFIPTADELNRGLVALAGAGLAFVAFGGGVVLLAARRQLGVAR